MLESILRPLATLGADGPGWLLSMTLWTFGLLAVAWRAQAGEVSMRRQAARLLLRERPRSEHVGEARGLAR